MPNDGPPLGTLEGSFSFRILWSLKEKHIHVIVHTGNHHTAETLAVIMTIIRKPSTSFRLN